jgi:hypothetical protein
MTRNAALKSFASAWKPWIYEFPLDTWRDAGRSRVKELIAFWDVIRIYWRYMRGVGWIDIHLLASAVVERPTLRASDSRFAAFAQEIGVTYRGATS